jgi:hypothetical protein
MVKTSTVRPSLAVLGVALLAGCVTIPTNVTISNSQYRAYTSGVIGCPAEEVTISGERTTVSMSDFPVTWRATCRGHKFICSHGGGNNDTGRCAEELEPAAPTAAPASPRP